MTIEEFENQEKAISDKIAHYNDCLRHARNEFLELKNKFLSEYNNKVPYGTKIEITGLEKKTYFDKPEEVSYICYVGDYRFVCVETTSLSDDDELVAPVLYQCKKDGSMSNRIFKPKRLTHISYKILS